MLSGRADVKYSVRPSSEMNGASVTPDGVLTLGPRFRGALQGSVTRTRVAAQMPKAPMFPSRADAKYSVRPFREIEGENSAAVLLIGARGREGLERRRV